MSAETQNWLENNVLVGFAEKRGKAWWHKRGTDSKGRPNHYDGAIPIDDVLERLLYWDALSAEVVARYTDHEGNDVEILDETRQAIIREDTGAVFGIFKQGYQIHQHSEWLLEVTSQIMDTSSSDLAIANAVLLKRGAVACVQYEVPENIKTSDGLEIRPSLLAAGSLDGTLATTYARVITNVVCDNTMAAALSEKDAARLKIKHSKYSGLKLADARDKLDIVFDIADEFLAEAKALLETPVTGKQFKMFLNEIAPLPEDTSKTSRALTMAEKKRDDLLTLWVSDPRVAPWQGNAYGVWQMMNTYQHHVVGTNGTTVRAERNMFEAANGKLAKQDSEALSILLNKVLVNA